MNRRAFSADLELERELAFLTDVDRLFHAEGPETALHGRRTLCVFFLSPLLSSSSSIRAMMLVWRIRGKIIRTVLFYIVYHNNYT